MADPADLVQMADSLSFQFRAMGSPCEVRIETTNPTLALAMGDIVKAEALRIEARVSRYRDDSVISMINRSGGQPLRPDREPAALLDYAANCFALSQGLFDVTSGVLRRVWTFDGSDNVPSKAAVRALLPRVGWAKVSWDGETLVLPEGMEVDFGGIGKEYAVDCAIFKLAEYQGTSALVNFGGDLRVTAPRRDGNGWRVAIESVDVSGAADGLIELRSGALTTSGDSRRFLLRGGKRYSHILDPRTGWPVRDPPRAVTVAAATCLEAGLLSTLAMLQGKRAETFLKREGLKAWWVR